MYVFYNVSAVAVCVVSGHRDQRDDLGVWMRGELLGAKGEGEVWRGCIC